MSGMDSFSTFGRESSTTTQSSPARAAKRTTQPASSNHIVWQDSVVVHFADQKVVRANGAVDTKQRMKDATFYKGVKLTEVASAGSPQEGGGNWMQCNELQTTMAMDADGRQIPDVVTAIGNVIASQDATTSAPTR